MKKISEILNTNIADVKLNDDESIIIQCSHTIYANCNKKIVCQEHREQFSNKVLIYKKNNEIKRNYLCPHCLRDNERRSCNYEVSEKKKKEERLIQSFINTGIGNRYINVDINNNNISLVLSDEVINQVINAINQLNNGYHDLIIMGEVVKSNNLVNTRCGKTLTVAAIIKGLLFMDINISIKYITYNELMLVLKSRNEIEINSFKKAEILFIDDINCTYSEYSEQQFKDFIDFRYRYELSTVAVIESQEFINVVLNKFDNASIIKLQGVK